MLLLPLLLAVLVPPPSVMAVVEEVHVHGPMDLHNHAMNTYMDLRRKDPTQNLSHEGELMQRANRYAIKRLRRKPEEALSLRKLGDDLLQLDGGEGILQLPSPEGQDSFLTSAVNDQDASAQQVMLPQERQALAMAFNEEIGLGAIAKAGALPMGTSGEWLHFAEKKLKNEENLDYQALLWEIGSEVAETRSIEQGGLNLTYEQELLNQMDQWFQNGGGKLHFAQPVVTQDHGFQLLAKEDVHESEPILSVPLKLIMCKQTARNVLIQGRGKYLGEELTKTFEKNEVWGLAIFLLHEYYKEVAGKGSKWGPFLRTLRMRFLSTPVIQSLKGTIAAHLNNQWLKSSDGFMWWSVGADGPCSPTTSICKSKPLDRTGDTRFNIHQIRWAYWVVKQHAVRVRQMATGLDFLGLIPYYHMLEKRMDSHGDITFDFDGMVTIRAGSNQEEGFPLSIYPGNLSDAEFFLRYLHTPRGENPHTEIKLRLPGVIPKGSKFHYCIKGTQKEQNRDDCKASYRSESMFWKSKVLTEWRQLMNLPPRLQELRMWATRLHLYGGKEEMALLSTANQMIAGLPIPTDQMAAEEQLMLLGVARDNLEAAVIASGPQGERPPPQLYSAPDPQEDSEADRAMQHLATLAVQAHNTITAGNVGLNATQVVLNATRAFFQHGVLPMAGLDELDMFLLKKIGMLAHCGFENDMKITEKNITKELMCAMRVHLMNESEIHVFCPKEARVFEDNCLNVEFMNYTAISETNEYAVIQALQKSIQGLLASYPTTLEEDQRLLSQAEDGIVELGVVMLNAIYLRHREKRILHQALVWLDDHEANVKNGSVPFQLAIKAEERRIADLREAEHQKFVAEVRARAKQAPPLASVEVNLGDDVPKVNLTLVEGASLQQTVRSFCQQHQIQASYLPTLEKALQARVVHPPPYQLLLGVITPTTGDRRILGIAEGTNATVETGVFCAKYDPDAKDVTATTWCMRLLQRVEQRLNTSATFQRKILLVVPIDAPDTRKLQLILREGEQHDLLQFVSDFLEYYHMPLDNAYMVAQEVNKRLPGVALQIPVGLPNQRQVAIRFALNDNITNVVEAFANYYDLEDAMKVAIYKRARYGMAPGTFLV